MKSFINALSALNIIIQSFFNFATPIGFAILVLWFFGRKNELAGWVYVLLILVGVGIGFYSMIRFILTAMKNLEQLEQEQKKRKPK